MALSTWTEIEKKTKKNGMAFYSVWVGNIWGMLNWLLNRIGS